jgi:uncharacterized protein (DUF2147 family)
LGLTKKEGAVFRILITIGILAGALDLASSVALADDVIVGKWKTQAGDTAAITHCGTSFCAKLQDGKYAGRQIGKLTGGNGDYKGQLTDPGPNKTYNGAGSVKGNSLTLKGCVMKVFCQTQIWTRL